MQGARKYISLYKSITELIKKINFFYRIFTHRFIQLANWTIEAFSTQRDLLLYWYEPLQSKPKKQPENEKSKKENKEKRLSQQGQRGCYYTSYKFWRKFFREAGICEADDDSDGDEEGISVENDLNAGIVPKNFLKKIAFTISAGDSSYYAATKYYKINTPRTNFKKILYFFDRTVFCVRDILS